MSQIRLRILGESVIQVGETTVEPSATHLFALLLYLSIERGKLISRGQLASLLFPEAGVANAGHNLRQLLYRLRRLGVPLETTAAAVKLPAESVVEAPESALTRSHAELMHGGSLGFVLLPSYSPPTPPLSGWLETYRDSISSKLLRCLGRELARAREGADWTAVERFAHALLDLDPLNETATLGLAEAMARSGSKHKAVKLLHDFADDVGQSHETLALPSRLLTRRISEDIQPTASGSSRTPLVGRSDELRSLTEAWSHARKGHCTIAVITGEKSIGKTRVLEELCALVRMDGSGVVLETRTQVADCERPMSLFSDLCLPLLALPGAAGCSPDSLPHLRRLRGGSSLPTEEERPDIDLFLPEGATRLAVVDLLDSVASERPLLLCVDDADHLDDSSRDLLASLPELAASLPVLAVVAGNRLSRLPPRRNRTLRLGPLSTRNARHLAQSICERTSHSPSSEALDWCVDAAAGNPGHLDLLVRHSGTLRDAPVAPHGLIALLDSSLDSLSSASKHVLQACVTFGAECCPATIGALTGLSGYELLTSLEGLVEEGFVTDSDSGIACRSSLLADRVRHSTTEIVRKLFHQRAALFLEESRDEAWATQAAAWRIAEHWQGAGNRLQALKWRRTCWRQLLSIGQPMAAAESIRGYLRSSSSDRQRAELLDDLILALQHASQVSGQLAALEDRVALCNSIGDTAATRLRLAADIADARYYNYEDTTSLLPELQALVASTDLDEIRRLRTARILMVAADGLFDGTLACSVHAAMPRQTHSFAAALLKDQVEVIYQTDFGDREEALCLARKLDVLLNNVELSPASISAQLTASLALHIVDPQGSSMGNLERLYERCLAASMNDAAVRTSVRIGSINFEVGALAAADYWCERATELIERSGIERLGSDFLTLRIDLALERGDLPTAQKLIDIAPQHFQALASPRARREYLVFRTYVDQQHDRVASRSDIEQLLEYHDRAKHLGRHDDHMHVLWTALQRAGRHTEASHLLREYLLFSRRERRPANFTLRTRTEEDAIWEDLPRDRARG